MKIALIMLCTAVAVGVQAATITSKDGKVVDGEVVSYVNGIFNIRSAGSVFECPAASIRDIQFETAAGSGSGQPERVEIVKVSTIVARCESGEDYLLKPIVRIDCLRATQELKQRPLILLRLFLKDIRTGTLQEKVIWYNWDGGHAWRDSELDPKKVSKDQPQCDWQNLSAISLSYLDDKRTSEPGIRFKTKPKVLAYRAEVWLGGEVVRYENEVKDWNFKLPPGWK